MAAMPLALKANYHDGLLEALEIGPRREITLSVRLDPVWNGGDDRVQRLHLSAIENFDEVRAFFDGVASAEGSDQPLGEVLGIARSANGVVVVDLSPQGYVAVRTRKVREL